MAATDVRPRGSLSGRRRCHCRRQRGVAPDAIEVANRHDPRRPCVRFHLVGATDLRPPEPSRRRPRNELADLEPPHVAAAWRNQIGRQGRSWIHSPPVPTFGPFKKPPLARTQPRAPQPRSATTMTVDCSLCRPTASSSAAKGITRQSRRYHACAAPQLEALIEILPRRAALLEAGCRGSRRGRTSPTGRPRSISLCAHRRGREVGRSRRSARRYNALRTGSERFRGHRRLLAKTARLRYRSNHTNHAIFTGPRWVVAARLGGQ